MQNLIFKKLIIKGFGSIQNPLEIDLNNKKLNLIKGVNGTGKSSIINSLFWCLYGETLKEKSSVELWDNLRDENYKGTCVEVHFKSGGILYRVIRMKGWKDKVEGARGSSRLLVYYGKKKKLYKSDDKRDVQKFLTERLGVKSDILKNSVIFGQKVSRITQEKGVKRKEILDNLFNLAYVNTAKDRAQFDLNDLTQEIKKLVTKRDLNEGKLETVTESFEDNIEFNRGVSKNLKKAIAEKEEEIKKEKLNLKLLIKEKAKIKVPKKLKSKEFKTTKFDDKFLLNNLAALGVLDVKVTNIENDINSILDECPTCGRAFNKKEIAEQRKKLKHQLKELKAEKTVTQGLIEGEKVIQNKIEVDNKEIESNRISWDKKAKIIERNITTAKWEIESRDKEILQSKKDIKRLQNEMDGLPNIYQMKDVDNLKKQKIVLEKEIFKLNKKISIKTKRKGNLEWLVSDALSNKGLKTYIFSHLLLSINEKLLNYSGVSGFLMKFEVGDNTKKDINITVYKDNYSVKLSDLSGGQKQLLDIISIFAIHDVLQQDLKVKTLFLDEVFESLSVDNIEKVDELIQLKLSQRITVFLITHLKDYNPVNADILELELVNGITKTK